MTPSEIIAALAATSSRKEKEAIVEAALEESEHTFFEGCRLAYDALITFGVKKVPERKGREGEGLSWTDFRKLADQLIDRELTGHAARDAIAEAMQLATNEEWNGWYRRILIKDLRCGVTETTINNVLESTGYDEYVIPVFTCQLAHDGTDNPKKMRGEKLVEVKLDGVRVLTIVYPTGRVDQYSRSGKELVNFEHIKAQFAQVANMLMEPWVFDGEVMSSSFQDLMKQIHRKENAATNDAVLHLFDCLPLDKFQEGKWDACQSFRIDHLHTFVDTHKAVLKNVAVLDHELVDLDTSEGQQRFREINASAVDGGFEGIMLKEPSAPYELKRSHAWLKVKPVITVDLVVMGLQEGTGKNVGRLGALVCEGEDNGRAIRVNVGSGFSDDQRDDFWSDAGAVKGELVEVMADAVTQNQDGSYSLRFPRFVRFRNIGGVKV